MKILLTFSGLDPTPSIKTYAHEKIGSLDRYVRRFETQGEIEAVVELARTTHHHHKGDVFRAIVMLKLPGKTLRAEHVAHDIRVAIDRVRKTLRLELAKYRAVHLMRRLMRRTGK